MRRVNPYLDHLGAWRVCPGQVCEGTVDGDAENVGAEGMELGGAVAEGDDLGWADEGEVEWVEEENEVFAGVVG